MLGICVVYLASDEDGIALMRMGLAQIAATTTGPFQIFGHALRMPVLGISLLDKCAVERPPIAPFEAQPFFATEKAQAGEHIYYLDQLVDAAVRAGCEHVAVFDMDSWPIASGWNAHYLPCLAHGDHLVAVKRAELGDNFPHPCFTLFHRRLWTPGISSFGVGQRNLASPEEVAGISRPTEPGVGLLVDLRRKGLGWTSLGRSNAWNPHRVMCGIYDRKIFHFGAGSRTPYFAIDKQDYEAHGNALRNHYRLSMNRAERHFYLEALKKQPQKFMMALLGQKSRTAEEQA